MFHLAAWGQSLDQGNALTPINAVREQTLFTNGVDLRVPELLPFIIGGAALCNDASVAQAQIQSPSLRVRTNLDIEPIINALVFGTPAEATWWPDAPLQLAPDEALNFAILADPAAAVQQYGFAMLADGPQSPVTGDIFTVRATAAATLVVNTWVNANLTLSQVLPAGRYQVVGMRARGTNLVAARLVFSEQTARPGVYAVNAIADGDTYWQRYGRLGVFGEFPNTIPPTVDCLGVTDTAQVFQLDLIRVR